MKSRQRILDAIRRNQPPPAELPELTGEWICFPDPRQQFVQSLESVAGASVSVDDVAELNVQLQHLPVYRDAKHICALIDGIGASTVDANSVEDPHQLESIDVAVVRGEFAVAENGAVWVTDRGIRHRVILFLAQHIVLVVPAKNIISNMHEAYSRLQLGEREFGVFISGPSKTADIEQSLVIGAHGARSLTVFLVEHGLE